MDCTTNITVSAVYVVDSSFELCDDKHNKYVQVTPFAVLDNNQITLPRDSSLIALAVHHDAGNTDRIASGDFRSVIVHQDQVYAADRKKCQTQVFRYNKTLTPRWPRIESTGWTKVKSIDHDFKQNNWPLTLSISNNQLKCCSIGDDSIKVYSLSGELLRTYGTRGSGDAGRLDCPYISDDDDDGRVLIADRNNNRLQVMSEQGEVSVLQLQPPVTSPLRAVLFKNHVFVASWDKKAIYKYSC